MRLESPAALGAVVFATAEVVPAPFAQAMIDAMTDLGISTDRTCEKPDKHQCDDERSESGDLLIHLKDSKCPTSVKCENN